MQIVNITLQQAEKLMNTQTKKIEHAQKILKDLPNVISGLEALNRILDADMTYIYDPDETNEHLDLKNLTQKAIRIYGKIYQDTVAFLDHEEITPYPLDNEWWSEKQNQEWAARWGIKKMPWWKRLLKSRL